MKDKCRPLRKFMSMKRGGGDRIILFGQETVVGLPKRCSFRQLRRKAEGVMPECFLKASLKTDLELNPLSIATCRTFISAPSGPLKIAFANSMRRLFTNS